MPVISRDVSTSLDMTHSKRCAVLSQLVRRDFELVPVGIAEIDGVRNFVILKFEFDSAVFQFVLCGEKIFPVRAKSEVKHSDVAAS